MVPINSPHLPGPGLLNGQIPRALCLCQLIPLRIENHWYHSKHGQRCRARLHRGRPRQALHVGQTSGIHTIRARDTSAAAQRRRMCHISESIAVLVSSSATHWSLLPNYRHMYHIAQSITVTIKPRVSISVRVRVSLALSYEAYMHTAKGISLSLPLVSLSLCLSVCLSVPAPVAILSLSLSAHEQTPLYLCTCILCIP